MRGNQFILVLIGVCVALELVLMMGDWGLFGAVRLRQEAYEYFAFWPGLLFNWTPNYPAQPYIMYVTYGFFHINWLHLLVNMLTLWSLGSAVLRRVGVRGFLIIYVASLLGGAAFFGLFAPDLRMLGNSGAFFGLIAPGLQMVGASGALFGLAGALLSWAYVDRYTYHQGLLPVAQAMMLLIVLNLILWWVMSGQLAWQTHLGGFVAGWIAALVADPRPQSGDASEP